MIQEQRQNKDTLSGKLTDGMSKMDRLVPKSGQKKRNLKEEQIVVINQDKEENNDSSTSIYNLRQTRVSKFERFSSSRITKTMQMHMPRRLFVINELNTM